MAKNNIKTATDILMAAAVVSLMSYDMIAQSFHEITGCLMFVLFIAHLCLNGKYLKHIFKGRYTPYRAVQTALVLLCFICLIGCMASGIVISQTVFSFLNLHGIGTARRLHMLFSYWGFAFMGVHIGLHLSAVISKIKRHITKRKNAAAITASAAALLGTAYGVYAFIARDFANYLTLKNHFAFYDYSENIFFVLFDYLAVMWLFVFAGHLLKKALTAKKKRKE